MVRAILQNLTLRLGRKYNDPSSVASIKRACRNPSKNVKEEYILLTPLVSRAG